MHRPYQNSRRLGMTCRPWFADLDLTLLQPGCSMLVEYGPRQRAGGVGDTGLGTFPPLLFTSPLHSCTSQRLLPSTAWKPSHWAGTGSRQGHSGIHTAGQTLFQAAGSLELSHTWPGGRNFRHSHYARSRRTYWGTRSKDQQLLWVGVLTERARVNK